MLWYIPFFLAYLMHSQTLRQILSLYKAVQITTCYSVLIESPQEGKSEGLAPIFPQPSIDTHQDIQTHKFNVLVLWVDTTLFEGSRQAWSWLFRSGSQVRASPLCSNSVFDLYLGATACSQYISCKKIIHLCWQYL